MMALNPRVFVSKSVYKLHLDEWGLERSFQYWQTMLRLFCVTLRKIQNLKC